MNVTIWGVDKHFVPPWQICDPDPWLAGPPPDKLSQASWKQFPFLNNKVECDENGVTCIAHTLISHGMVDHMRKNSNPSSSIGERGTCRQHQSPTHLPTCSGLHLRQPCQKPAEPFLIELISNIFVLISLWLNHFHNILHVFSIGILALQDSPRSLPFFWESQFI